METHTSELYSRNRFFNPDVITWLAKSTLNSIVLFSANYLLAPYFDQHGRHDSSTATIATAMIVVGITGRNSPYLNTQYNTRVQTTTKQDIQTGISIVHLNEARTKLYDYANEQ